MTQTEAILTIARAGNARAAEEALMTALENPSAPVEEWPAIVEQIAKAARGNAAETIAWATLDAILMRLSPIAAMPHCGKILRLFSASAEFRNRAVELYQQAYGQVQTLAALIEISGLKGGKPIRRALQTLDICLAIQTGSFLVHKDEGPPARVLHVDPESWNIRIQTPDGEELFDPVTLGDHYEAAAPDDFRVLQQFDSQRFAALLAEQPAQIVLTVIKAHNNHMTSDDLEAMLSPRYIPAEEWAKWWTKARTTLKKNPNIRLEGRNPVTIRYELKTISLEDEMGSRFSVHAPPKSWLDLAQEYQRESAARGQAHSPDFFRKLRDAAQRHGQEMEGRGDQDALAVWLSVAELSRLAGDDPDLSDAARVLEGARSLREAFLRLPADAYWPMALECVRAARSSWPGDYADLLAIAPPGRSDEIAAKIREAGAEPLLVDAVRTIWSDPIANVNGLCWLYQGPKNPTGLEIPSLTKLLTRLFSVLDQVNHSSTLSADLARDIRARIRSVLSARKYVRFNECLDQVDEGMADALRTTIRRAEGLTDNIKADLMNCIRNRFPALWVKPQKQLWEDDQTLYCTDAGYNAKNAELEELVNVKMKQNAIAIGEAAARGDLSENSEYKSALEERDLLRARVAEIQSQMSMARVIHRDEVRSDHVGIGSRVRFKNLDSGQNLTLTFLGPWESNVEGNILNYQAPISRRLMGLRIGETAEFELKGLKGAFEVLSIETGIS